MKSNLTGFLIRVGVCLLVLAAALPLAAQEDRELWVPAGNLEAVLQKMPRAVLLTREQYERLRTEFTEARIKNGDSKVVPPVSAVIRSARMTGSAEPGAEVVAIEALYEVECFTEEWAEVPLLLPKEQLGHVKIDSRSALRAGSDKPAVLLTHGKGTHTVRATFHLPVTRNTGGNSITVRSPGVPASLDIAFPADAEIDSPLPFVQKDGRAIFALPSEKGDGHEIQWTAQKVATIPGAAIIQSCSYFYNLDATSVRADFGIVISSSLADLPRRFALRFPEEYRILSLEGSELLKWTQSRPGVIEATLVPGDRDAADLRLQVERDLEATAEGEDISIDLPLVAIDGIHRASGTLTVVGSPGVRVKTIETGPLTAPIPDDTEGPAASIPHYVASFQFPVSSISPTVTLSPVRDRFVAQMDTLVNLTRESIELTRNVKIQPREGNLFRTVLQIPESEEIVSVESSGEGFAWKRTGESAILLSWENGIDPATASDIIIKTRRDPEGWFSLGEEAEQLVFSEAEIEGAEATSGYVAVRFDPSFEVETVSADGLEPRDGRTTPVTGTLAWFRLEDFDLTLNASRKSAEIEAEINSYVLPLASTIEIEGEIRLLVLYSGIEEIDVLFPPDVAPLVRFDSPRIAEQTLLDDGETWQLRFHQEQSGGVAYRFRLVLPMNPGEAEGTELQRHFVRALPAVRLPAAKRLQGHWIIEANTDTELSFEASGLDPVDSLQVPIIAGYEPRHRVISAFEYRGDEWKLTLSGERHEHAEVVSTVIDSLRLDTVVSVDGSERHQATAILRSSGEQFLELDLPADAILWTLSVDGIVMKPVRAGKDRLRVQLPAHEKSDTPIRIDLIYQTPGRRWGGSGREKLEPIRVAERIPVMQAEWYLHLPEGFDYQKFRGNLTQNFQVVDRLLLGEAARVAGRTVGSFELGVPGSGYVGGRPAGYSSYATTMPETRTAEMSTLERESRTQINMAGERRDLEGSDRQRRNYYDAARDQTRATFLREIAEGWEMPVPVDVTEEKERTLPADTSTGDSRMIEEKLKTIIIPSVEFTDTPLRDALAFLSQRSVELDTNEADPAKKGVNIVSMVPEASDTPITLRLTNVPLSEALRYTTSLAQTKYREDPNAVVVVPLSTPDQDLVTRVYTVPPTFLSSGIGGSGGAGAADPFADPVEAGSGIVGTRKTAKDILESAGITFASGSTAIYDADTGNLIVRNSQDQQELVEAYNQSISAGVSPEEELERRKMLAEKYPGLGLEESEDMRYAKIGHGGKTVDGVQRRNGETVVGQGGTGFSDDSGQFHFAYPYQFGTNGDTEDKIPYLGDLPTLGALFKKSEETSEKTVEELGQITLEDGLDLSNQTLEEATRTLNERLAELPSDQYPAATNLQLQWGIPGSEEGNQPVEAGEPLDLKLGRITVLEALDRITGATNTHYRVTASGVVIAPADVPLEPMETIFLPLPVSEFQVVEASGEPKSLSARSVLTNIGIGFPPGSSAAYNPASGRLAVRNTQANLEAIMSHYSDLLASAQSSNEGFPANRASVPDPEELGGVVNLRGFDINDIGKLPIPFELPESGRSYRFSGFYAPDTISFRFVNWERQIRLAWIWILVGGLLFWFGALRRLRQPIFLGLAGAVILAFVPLVVSASLTAFCNALLIGWLTAMALALIVHISRKVVRHEA